jgi:hypothetical protein
VPTVPSSVKRLARSSRISLRWGATLARLREGKMPAAASRPRTWRRLIKAVPEVIGDGGEDADDIVVKQ